MSKSKCLFAYTAPGSSYPAFLAVNHTAEGLQFVARAPAEPPSLPGAEDARSWPACGATATTVLPGEQLMELIQALLNHRGDITGKPSVCLFFDNEAQREDFATKYLLAEDGSRLQPLSVSQLELTLAHPPELDRTYLGKDLTYDHRPCRVRGLFEDTHGGLWAEVETEVGGRRMIAYAVMQTLVAERALSVQLIQDFKAARGDRPVLLGDLEV